MLNPALYARLKSCFGTVRISKEDTHEEEYRVNCPYCGDTKYRLNINHAWGMYDPLMGSDNRGMIHCFNEDCLSFDYINIFTEGDRIEELLQYVYGGETINIGTIHRQPRKRVVKHALTALPTMLLLDELYRAMPGHQAIRYVLDERGFDPVELGQKYRIGYATSDNKVNLQNRIVIPFYVDGICRSWTARYIGNKTPDGRTLKEADIPKYYNALDTSVDMILFNIDLAKKYRFIIITEGAFDAIKVGENAIATNTKRISATMLNLLSRWSDYHGGETTVAIMYDPEQPAHEAEQGKRHHMDRALDLVRPVVGQAFSVWLPIGVDPGDLTREQNREHIERSARENEIKLDWRAYNAEDFTSYPSDVADSGGEPSGLGRIGRCLLTGRQEG